MLSVEIKPLLKRLNPFCTRALEGAAGLCVSRSHYEVTVEHFVSRLLDEIGADWYLILKQFGINSTALRKSLDRTLEEMRSGNAGKPAFSPLLLQWIQDAWLLASVNLGEVSIRSGSLLLALLAKSSPCTTSQTLHPPCPLENSPTNPPAFPPTLSVPPTSLPVPPFPFPHALAPDISAMATRRPARQSQIAQGLLDHQRNFLKALSCAKGVPG
jgi:hypothetical protein